MVFPTWHGSTAKLVRSKRVDSVKCLRVKSEGALLSLKICSGEGSSFIVFWLRTDWTDFVLIIILSLFFIILWPNEIFFPKFGRNRRDSFFFSFGSFHQNVNFLPPLQQQQPSKPNEARPNKVVLILSHRSS